MSVNNDEENQQKLLDYFNSDSLAANVWKDKYADKGEITPEDMFRREAKEFYRIDYEYQQKEEDNKEKIKLLSKYGQERKSLTYDSIYKLFDKFKQIVPQGSIMSTLGTNIIASLSNCYVIPEPVDSYAGILFTDSEMAQLYKRRGGVGTGISSLRPNGTSTNNVGKTSTGAVSFMERFSNTTREVAMNGRRGALMLTIDCRHPDVFDFINIKKDRSKVTGANISVLLRDDFMGAVEKGEDYFLRFPCDAPITFDSGFNPNAPYNILMKGAICSYKRIKARELYEQIIENAWENAEPGQIFLDKVIDYSPDGVYPQYKPKNSNPCGEQFLPPYDSCRLMLLNLFSIIDDPFSEGASINKDLLYSLSYEMNRLGDDLVDLEVEQIDKILDKIKSDPEEDYIKQPEYNLWLKVKETALSARRFGGGITALGDMLAALNLKYDSNEALEVIEEVMSIKMRAELDCTTDLAILRGTFKDWDNSKEFHDIQKLGEVVNRGSNSFYDMLWIHFPEQVKRMQIYGRRCVSWSTISPAGSVSLMTQTSSGCEPIFSPYHIRRKKINPSEKSRADFVDQSGDSWTEYPVFHPKFKDWIEFKSKANIYADEISNEDLEAWFEESPWYKSTANDINWERRVKIQSILQKYTTNAISSTINLPETVTKEEVKKVYLAAYNLGCKGVTVYRDNCRTGVLINKKNVNNKAEDSFIQHDAPKRPRELPCDIYTTNSKGVKWNVVVGLYDNNPYEVFATPHFTNKEHATLVKTKKGIYDLYIEKDLLKENITKDMNNEEEVVTRLISTSLRHGASVSFLVEQLNKTDGVITSFNKSIARCLKHYIKEGTKSKEGCPNCGEKLIFEEGCKSCKHCGTSFCG